MNEALVLRKLKTDFAGVSGMSTAIPGMLMEGLNTGTLSPYARCEITTDEEGYTSDEARYAKYSILVEVFADNPTPAEVVTIENKLQLLLAATKSGTMGGVSGEATGSVNYAWQKPPGGKSLMTAAERRAGKTTVAKKLAMSIRVQWS